MWTRTESLHPEAYIDHIILDNGKTISPDIFSCVDVIYICWQCDAKFPFLLCVILVKKPKQTKNPNTIKDPWSWILTSNSKVNQVYKSQLFEMFSVQIVHNF